MNVVVVDVCLEAGGMQQQLYHLSKQKVGTRMEYIVGANVVNVRYEH